MGTNKANNEPILFGAEEGPGVLAVGRSGNNQGTTCANAGVAFRIDGLTITGSDSGGGILASGYDCNLQITNNRVVGNYGTFEGDDPTQILVVAVLIFDTNNGGKVFVAGKECVMKCQSTIRAQSREFFSIEPKTMTKI